MSPRLTPPELAKVLRVDVHAGLLRWIANGELRPSTSVLAENVPGGVSLPKTSRHSRRRGPLSHKPRPSAGRKRPAAGRFSIFECNKPHRRDGDFDGHG